MHHNAEIPYPDLKVQRDALLVFILTLESDDMEKKLNPLAPIIQAMAGATHANYKPLRVRVSVSKLPIIQILIKFSNQYMVTKFVLSGSYPAAVHTSRIQDSIDKWIALKLSLRVIFVIDTHSAAGSGQLVYEPERIGDAEQDINPARALSLIGVCLNHIIFALKYSMILTKSFILVT